ncbi:hypothetical protein OIK40_12415 [Erythrobacter sp. sf7]|uniref:Uncharacterized protein n=1 Tax=Erythrobacter fulvus TaxID=2987523 RepID=A0ABT5JSS3_9SPHN|nr:hypothetical protein [Erythrobacter fulvus]MDC8755445.1 hypothetical protein [Erythrobacter fulvus]
MARAYDETAFGRLRDPVSADYKKIAKDLGLNPEQQWYLITTVKSALEKCRRHHDRRILQPDLDRMHECAVIMDKKLKDLEATITATKGTINALGLPENVGSIGRLLSFEAVAEIAGHDRIDCELPADLRSSGNPEPLTLLKLEWEYAERKQLLDARNRADFLLHIARKMRRQFSQWLVTELPDPGGAAALPFRRIMLFELACHASLILGEHKGRPAITRTGGVRFVALCVAVLHECKIDGADASQDAIKNFLEDHEVWTLVKHWNGFGD